MKLSLCILETTRRIRKGKQSFAHKETIHLLQPINPVYTHV